MSRVTVWKEPAWGDQFVQVAARWCVDDGYKTTVADSWRDAMRIAWKWAGVK